MIQRETVRVVVTQGFCLLRSALVERLEREPWIEVCATASGLEETQQLIKQHRPNVLVMNTSLKCSAGLVSLRKLKRGCRGLSILAFSCDAEFEDLYAGLALRAGADGYISAMDGLEDIVWGIWSVHTGERFLSLQMEEHRREHVADEAFLDGLSRREAEVFFLIGCGYSTQRIAKTMELSVKTVESYRERIRKKMNLRNGAELLRFSSSFMRTAARRGVKGAEKRAVKEVLSTKR